MNVVIVGAGDIGLHVAALFSALEYGIVLIDKDPLKLEVAARDLDVITRASSGTDWELLEELRELSPDLLVALTDHDETNLVACSMAKNLGFPQTIARARSHKYFLPSPLFFERLFSVDYLIGPERLTAESLANMVLFPDAINIESFSHGNIQLRTMQIPPHWKKSSVSLKEKEKLSLPPNIMVALIKRGETIIFPHGNDVIQPNDEVTFIGETDAMDFLYDFLKIKAVFPRSAVIVGGSLVGIELAKRLVHKQIKVTIIDKNFNKCRILSEILPTCTILYHNGADYSFLQSENIGSADVFIACTREDEVNFLASSVASDLGAKKVLLSLSDTHYLPLLKKLNIHQSASPRITAANRILSIAREKKVASMVSLYDSRAEVLEVKVSSDSKIAGIPLRHLGKEFPNDFLIAVIHSRGEVFVADGNRVLSPGDTAIVISHPRHIAEIKRLF